MPQAIEQGLFHELGYYTLAHPDPHYFIHQLAVDAFTAQHADEHTKAVAITFALAGLYLVVEKGYSGKEAQLAHMAMAKKKTEWPVFELPTERGSITIKDVLAHEPGAGRDEMIRAWCREVWRCYASQRAKLLPLLP